MEQTIVLSSPRLKVELAQPGSVYRGARFDWSGFITQVTLDGKHTFCVPESYKAGEGTGGIGLCNEFGIEAAVGYDDARPGETFPKLGIGLLRRADEGPYGFFRPYEIVQQFPMSVEATADSAQVVVQPVECRGYAARLSKTYQVSGNSLQVAYTLENTGAKPIATHEYAHNFVGIDQQPVGPAYRLHFPYPVKSEKIDVKAMRGNAPPHLKKLPGFVQDFLIARYMRQAQGTIRFEGNDITFKPADKQSFYCRPQGFSRRETPQWTLSHVPSGVTVSETDDFAPWRVAVWGGNHVVSAEIFVDIRLQPGQTQRWARRYEFNAQP